MINYLYVCVLLVFISSYIINTKVFLAMISVRINQYLHYASNLFSLAACVCVCTCASPGYTYVSHI